jgi:hypothetical protein
MTVRSTSASRVLSGRAQQLARDTRRGGERADQSEDDTDVADG